MNGQPDIILTLRWLWGPLQLRCCHGWPTPIYSHWLRNRHCEPTLHCLPHQTLPSPARKASWTPMELELVFHPPPWCTQKIPYTNIICVSVCDHVWPTCTAKPKVYGFLPICKPKYVKFYLHLKSHDPAARSTLFGCQSKLRTVERMGFLMCLLTHLNTTRITTLKIWIYHWQSIIKHSNLPIIFRLKVANGYESCSAPHCKLVLQWRPFHECGSTVDPENNKGGFPHAILLTPYISIPVGSAGHNAITFRSPVNAYRLIQYQIHWPQQIDLSEWLA